MRKNRFGLSVALAAASVEAAIAQGRAGLMLGCPSFLLAPPFCFKGAGDEGLFDWFATALNGLGPRAGNVILYHIPQVTSVGVSMDHIRQFKKAFAPDLMKPLIDGIEEPHVNAMVEVVLPHAVTAAVKALVGHRRKDAAAWTRMQAPLKSLGASDCQKLFAAVDAIRARRAA